MAFKKMDADIGFADLPLVSSLKHNRSLKLMQNLNASIDWSSIEAILMNNYTAGTSTEGAKAYPPLLLFKCLLLQKWFRPSTIFRTYGAWVRPVDKIPSVNLIMSGQRG